MMVFPSAGHGSLCMLVSRLGVRSLQVSAFCESPLLSFSSSTQLTFPHIIHIHLHSHPLQSSHSHQCTVIADTPQASPLTAQISTNAPSSFTASSSSRSSFTHKAQVTTTLISLTLSGRLFTAASALLHPQVATHSSLSSLAIALSPLFAMGKGPKKKHNKRRPEVTYYAASYVAHWASLCKRSELSFSSMESSNPLCDWIPAGASLLPGKAPVVDFHSHSTCSDGMLTPVQLVEKAAASGVQVLALTDHDTMAGVPAAFETANRLGIRLIPGVEISAKVTAKTKNGYEEPVHILGYYSCCGPIRWQELEAALAQIREGRHQRAQSMISKLKVLKKPVSWESVVMLAGAGVAPGRLHIARALLEAGHVYSLREAFNKYLYDGGPAYSPGCELAAEDAVRLIRDTGGVAALAHPWSLKDALPVVKRLKEVGLHAMEVYRGDGKANVFATLADTYQLLKLGGSDFHGRGDPDETKLGKVALPVLAIREFLQVAEPIWIAAIKELLSNFSEESFEVNAENARGSKFFTGLESLKGDVALEYSNEKEHRNAMLKLSPWLTEEERQAVEEAAIQLNLGMEIVTEDGRMTCIVLRKLN